MARKTLYIIVTDYPYGLGEPFLEAELMVLSGMFEKMVIVIADGRNVSTDHMRYRVPANATIELLKPGSMKSTFSGLIRFLFSKVFYRELYDIVRNYKVKFSAGLLKLLLATWANGLLFRNAFEHLLSKNGFVESETSVYSYWFTNPVIGLAQLKQKYPGLKVVTRAHGWDCFFEVNSLNYLPFRPYTIGKLDAISFVSRKGMEYSSAKIPGIDLRKLRCDYLGIENIPPAVKTHASGDVLHLVSIAVIIPLKRIKLIVDALKLITREQIIWTHIGHEIDTDSTVVTYAHEQLKNHPSVKCHFTGEFTKQQVYEFLAGSQAQLLISVSSSEGLPVSMMEASAFGIPVVSTKVGGTNEIVESGMNGMLISENPDAEEIRDAILQFYYMPTEQYKQYSEYALSIFAERFSGERNFKKFGSFLAD